MKRRFIFLIGMMFFLGVASAGSGNFTICPSGCDYPSLAAWEDGEDGDLTGQGPSIAIINGSGFNESGVITIDGWTTTEEDYIMITVAEPYRHKGVWNDSLYFIEGVTVEDYCINNYEQFVHFDYLQMKANATLKAVILYSFQAAGAKSNITNNIANGMDGALSSFSLDSDVSMVIYNNVVYGFRREFFGGIYVTGVNSFIYNNIIANSYLGVRVNTNALGNATVINNIVRNCTGDDFYSESAAASDYNIDEDGTAPGLNSMTCDPLFVDHENKDFRIVNSSSCAVNNGTTMSEFSYDIAGLRRPQGSGWDIGAFEVLDLSSKWVIPEDSGSPFYVNSSVLNNPYTGSCSDLVAGESCVLTWEVVPNGTVGVSYEFFAYGSSENYYAESGKVLISIVGGEIIITLLNSTDFNVKNNESFIFSVNVSCPSGEETCEAFNLTLDPIVRERLEDMGASLEDIGAVVGGGLSVAREEDVGFFGRVWDFLGGLF